MLSCTPLEWKDDLLNNRYAKSPRCVSRHLTIPFVRFVTQTDCEEEREGVDGAQWKTSSAGSTLMWEEDDEEERGERPPEEAW